MIATKSNTFKKYDRLYCPSPVTNRVLIIHLIYEFPDSLLLFLSSHILSCIERGKDQGIECNSIYVEGMGIDEIMKEQSYVLKYLDYELSYRMVLPYEFCLHLI